MKRDTSTFWAEYADEVKNELRTEIVESDKLNVNADKLSLDEQSRVAKIRRFRMDTADRSKLAHKTYWLIVAWLSAVIVLLLGNSRLVHLSDSVIITLLATTTLNVLGLAVVVLNGYFRYMNQNIDI